MDNKNLHRLFALLSFATAMIVFGLTVQDSVPFWDCGEFSAAAIWQQVPHPPGAPLFLMIGKIFDILIPFGDPGWKINMASATSSAFAVLFLYLITVMAIKNFRKEAISTLGDALAVYGSAFVGAAAFTFSDTFWFNAVESEVYAMSTLFVSIIIYLMMRWNEEADNPGHERFLLLIAYLIGLSTGVHLLPILAIFSIVFLVYLRKYKTTFGGLMITGILSLVIFFVIYPFIVKWIPALLAGHSPGRNEVHQYNINDSTLLVIIALLFVFGAIGLFVWAMKNKKEMIMLASGAVVLVLMGYTTYTQILLRSNANPPMNENSPKEFGDLASYLGREQYGDDASWPRRIKTEDRFVRNYLSKDENGEYIYGEWFPPSRERVETSDGQAVTKPVWNRIDFNGEMAYLWKYQMVHMYWRYFGWNFVGKTSDEQDAGVAWFSNTNPEIEVLNDLNGYADEFPIRFFALPLIFGLIGFFFHFKEDRKMAVLHLVIFLMMGVLAAVAQQQQDPQPRERDYFYTGSFMVWCMWIGLGVYSLIVNLNKKEMKAGIAGVVVIVSTLLVPVNMAIGGWNTHDRTGNVLPFDYSYNLLQSADEGAIIFTNGDNDTFPVWYIQDVMGVRRDVRIVNLSLGQISWYVYQLKHTKPWGADKIPLTFSDESLLVDETDPRAFSYDFGEAFNLEIPVKREILAKYTDDENILSRGTFKALFKGQDYGEQGGKQVYLFGPNAKLVRDILQQIKFERPVYYSTTVGPDAYYGLEEFFRYEGMLMRICPVPQKTAVGDKIDIDVMSEILLNVNNTDEFSKTPKREFKMRNLNDPGVYYDPVHRRLMNSYRQLYTMLATSFISMRNDNEKATHTLDLMNKNISPTVFPMEYDLLYRISQLYKDAGADEQAKVYAKLGIERANKIITNENLRPDIVQYEVGNRYLGPHRYSAELYKVMGDYQGAIDVTNKLKDKVEELEQQLRGRQGYESQYERVRSNLIDALVSIDELEIGKLEHEGKDAEAMKLLQEKMAKYSADNTQVSNTLNALLNRRLMEMRQKQIGDSVVSQNTTSAN
jgi:transmembrane protein TMEM260 (protein O-mannosyltransferase)